MLEGPTDLNFDDLRALVSLTWSIEPVELKRLPVGGDSWSFRMGNWFVNVRDALGQRHSWRSPRDIELAFDAAIKLHDEACLDFLLAPTPTSTGRSLVRLGRFAVTAMPYLDGSVHYRPYTRSELAATTSWIAQLHAAPVRRLTAELPVERFSVECAEVLRTALNRAEDADVGPYSASLRALVRHYSEKVLSDLAEHEATAHRLRNQKHDLVTTHGEPFPGNVFHAADGHTYLIDLSELTVAPKERDLGHLLMLANPIDRHVPEQVYGTTVNSDLAHFYQRRWGLEEITIGIDHLSQPHTGTAQDDDTWTELITTICRLRDPIRGALAAPSEHL